MKKLKSLVVMSVVTLVCGMSSIALANQVVSKQIYKPNRHTTIVNQKVCGPRGCVNIHKKIRQFRNGSEKVVTQRCEHGFCNERVVIRR
jgi:hypothetical protein